MGRGSYLGGSTLITFRKPPKKKKGKKSSQAIPEVANDTTGLAAHEEAPRLSTKTKAEVARLQRESEKKWLAERGLELAFETRRKQLAVKVDRARGRRIIKVN